MEETSDSTGTSYRWTKTFVAWFATIAFALLSTYYLLYLTDLLLPLINSFLPSIGEDKLSKINLSHIETIEKILVAVVSAMGGAVISSFWNRK